MPFGISAGLFYGGLVFTGGFIIGYWMDSNLTQLLTTPWLIGLATGCAAVGVYVIFQGEFLNGLPPAF